MEIKAVDLKKATEKLLELLDGDETIEISEDFYWFVPTDRCYNPNEEPKKLTLGQLHDDWAELMKINDGKSESFEYALVWLSSILRFVGEKKSRLM